MNFFYKLFPYKSIVNIDNNTLTIWWVIITLIIFIIGVVFLIRVVNKIRKGILNSLKNFPENTNQINDNELEAVWEDYQDTFINYNGGRKTDEFSNDYFNEKNLISKKTNLKLLSSLPSILVGIGILGTFVGLTFGISNFKTTSTDLIKESIEVLLSGMGTAFISSIYGMLLSLVFTIIEKVQSNRLQSIIHEYCYKLDKQYKISKEDERKIQLLQQINTISDFFVHTDENNNQVKPANIFRDIYEESRKQSQALQSFSTDLSTKIEAGFETIMSNQIQKGVIPELQALKAEIENLGKKLQDPTTEMTQNIVKDLQSALGNMIDEFKTAMSGSTKSELEELTKLLSQAGSSLTDFPEKLQNMTDNLNNNFVKLQKVVQQISLQTLSQSEESTERMKVQVEEMSRILTTQVGELQIGQEELIGQQTKNIQISDKLLTTYNTSIEKMEGLSKEVTQTISEFSKVQIGLASVSNQFKLIADNVTCSSTSFKDAQLKFSQHSNEFLKYNSETIREIQNSLLQAKEVSAEFAQKFVVIENGLKVVFNQIQTGLTDYRDSVGDSLEVFLGKYTESLTKTAESLASASSKQEDILEGLTEQLDKFNSKKY